MPVYNEAPTVRRAIDDVLAADLGVDVELIVVDDGSTDGTDRMLQETDWPKQVRVLRHDRNRGKGAAVPTALAVARGEYAAIFDADLEYEPGDIATLLPALVDGRATGCAWSWRWCAAARHRADRLAARDQPAREDQRRQGDRGHLPVPVEARVHQPRDADRGRRRRKR